MPDPPRTSPTADPVADLIALGRDREAVDVARREPAVADAVAQIEQILPPIDEMLGQLESHHLGLSTPCARFDVAAVLDHMVGGAMLFTPAFRGETAGPIPPRDGFSVVDWWGRAIAELYIALHLPGALDREVDTPFGALPAATFARYVAFDGLVHGWDLAVATGLPFTPSDDLVRQVDAFIRGFLTAEMRDGDTFDEEQPAPAGASPMEQLAAFSGRTIPTKET